MAFIWTVCSPCARCKVELFIKYPPHFFDISIYQNSCLLIFQAGRSFFLLLPPILSAFPQHSLCGIHAAPFFVLCVGIGFRYRLCRHLSTVSCARALRTRGSFFLIVPTDNQHLHRGTFLPFLQKW